MTDRVADRVIETVAAAAPAIRRVVADCTGRREARNPSGDRQLAADVRADELFRDRLGAVEGVGSYASEERAAVDDVGDGLAVAVDPLDGSSNVASNNAVGTLFGVYEDELPAPAASLVAAGYVLYGPRTTMVAATDESVVEYDVSDGVQAVLDPDVRLPDAAGVYGFGGRVEEWPEAFRDFVREVERRGERKRRYAGTLVADVNQVLAHGGVFAYPRLRDRPSGKLRYQFEAAPVAYVVEAAGGASTDGRRSLLEAEPADLHERTPVHLGDPAAIDRLRRRLEVAA